VSGEPAPRPLPRDDTTPGPDGRPLRSLRRPDGTGVTVRVGPVVFGGPELALIAGPCAVEERAGLLRIAAAVAVGGAVMLRGGAWKPRTSPYDFQGLGADGLALLVAAREASGLPFVTEVLDPRDVEQVARVADMLQIGSRSVQNFPLLKEAGASGRPILLKRGLMTTVREWLCAAEYVLETGNEQVVLCERGIRTFADATRNTLDIGAVAVVKARYRLPVIVDPSHAAGDAAFVAALSRAAIAAGADGLLVEVHDRPAEALSDGRQALTPSQFSHLAATCVAVARACGRPA
jgi:3-deoxy-7-phosphoheptulonate synthase